MTWFDSDSDPLSIVFSLMATAGDRISDKQNILEAKHCILGLYCHRLPRIHTKYFVLGGDAKIKLQKDVIGAKLQFMDVLGSRVYWAPEITGLPGLPNRNLLSVFEAVKDLLNRKQI